MNMNQKRIVAVVVSYRPELGELFRLLDSLTAQVAAVVIVDNGSPRESLDALKARAQAGEFLFELAENLGIAAAQNRGVAEARSLGATHITLFDQDSSPAPDMIERLLECMLRLTEAGRRVAAVGPCYDDDRQANPPPFIRVRNGKLSRCLAPEEGDAVRVDYLIASGCLIPLDVIDTVGGMDESLFIDFVDIEWGQRARNSGYDSFGCFSARMKHSLGDEPIRFFGTAYPARSPLRHYYMFRNAVLLYRMKHIPLDWKWADGLRAILRFGFYALFAHPRHEHLKMMLLGLRDGLLNRRGKFGARR